MNTAIDLLTALLLFVLAWLLTLASCLVIVPWGIAAFVVAIMPNVSHQCTDLVTHRKGTRTITWLWYTWEWHYTKDQRPYML